MKKLFTFSYFVLFISPFLFAQNIGIGTNTPAASALLDITATNKGVLVPRVTNAQMLGIASPANGLLVYNTDSAAFAYRNATAWVFVKGNTTASNDWSTKGNGGTNIATNFIGTTDNIDVVFKRNNLRAAYIGSVNTSFGNQALNPASTGTVNTAIGYRALFVNTTGSRNTANGYTSLPENTTGSDNTAMGVGSLNTNSTGSGNTAIGNIALQSNSTANNNTAVGNAALNLNDVGYSNVAIGAAALQNNTNRSNLVAIGDSALYNNGTGATTSRDATANTATGSKALFSNNTGSSNTATGFESLKNNTTGNFNTAVGANALRANISGTENTAVGDDAMRSLTTGYSNTAFGGGSLRVNTEGFENTAIGYGVFAENTQGSKNTAIGHFAGFFAPGSSNVFLGHKAGYGEGGSNKLYITNSETPADATLLYGEFDNKILSVSGRLGINNTVPNGDLHFSNTLANRKIVLLEDANNDHQYNGFGINTFIMRYQAAALTSSHVFYAGSSPTTSVELMRITGNGEAGIGKIPLTSSDDSRLQIKQKGAQNGIGVEASNSTNHWDFYVTTEGASNFNLYYNGAFKGLFDNVTGAYTAASDRRLKKDITLQQPVLNSVMQLQAYRYHYVDNKSTDRFSNGFMAQEVQKLFPDAVVENDMKNGEKRLGINYQYFTVLAIKGLQEQQQKIQLQDDKIQLQEERIEKLEALVKTITEKK